MRFGLLLVVVSSFACGPAPEPQPQPVSFKAKVQPIFNTKCIACHYAGNLSKLDLTKPFSETEGLLNRETIWGTRAQHLQLVVPGKPEESQLMVKIDPSATIDTASDGDRMPITIADVTATELADIRTWITSGAADDAFYRSNVSPIFGTAANLGRAIGKCSYCHTATSLYSPDLVNAFSARGLVNVNSGFGGKRVLPGNPDDSVLVKKLAATVPATLGQKMPLNYPQLTADEVEIVRTWIAEGALDN
jgi:mono/diheme cytochrome c family protein